MGTVTAKVKGSTVGENGHVWDSPLLVKPGTEPNALFVSEFDAEIYSLEIDSNTNTTDIYFHTSYCCPSGRQLCGCESEFEMRSG